MPNPFEAWASAINRISECFTPGYNEAIRKYADSLNKDESERQDEGSEDTPISTYSPGTCFQFSRDSYCRGCGRAFGISDSYCGGCGRSRR